MSEGVCRKGWAVKEGLERESGEGGKRGAVGVWGGRGQVGGGEKEKRQKGKKSNYTEK